MTRYEFLLAVHVVAATVWVGGGALLQLLAGRARRAADPARLAAFAGDAEWAGTRVFVPSSLVVLVAGILAAREGGWDLSEPWIAIGFAAFLFSSVVGAGFLGPESGRIRALVADRGAASPEAGRRIARVLMVARVELVVLLVAVVAMVAKP